MAILLNRDYYYMGDTAEIKIQMENNLCATPVRKYHFSLERTIRATDFSRHDQIQQFEKSARCDKYKQEQVKFTFNMPLSD